jgi:uncharacterized protein YycO
MRFVLSRSGNVISKGIRWWSRGKWSHARLLFDDGVIIEAVWPRVRKVVFNPTEDQGNYQIFEVQTTRQQHADILSYAQLQIGKRYDLIGDLHFVTRQDYASQPDTKWFCSDLVFESFREGGIDLFWDTRGWEVWPDLLKRSMLAR